MATVAEKKNRLREEASLARRSMTRRERADASERICAHLALLPELRETLVIAAFWPTPEEVDLRHFLVNSMSAGRTVLLPRVVAKGRPLDMHNMLEGGLRLATGYCGIAEPSVDSQRFAPEKIPCALVPATSVDGSGNRVGSGLAFYDRTIAVMRQAVLVSPIYSCQLAGEVPAEPHDRPVDVVVTEDGPIRANAGAARPGARC